MQLTATCEPVIIRLPGRDPAHARDARRRARVLLAAWGLGEQAGLGELVVSELVTNAVCHGQPPIWIALSAAGGLLRVEVHDGGAGRPVCRHPGNDDEYGRGLDLLDALIQPHGGERGVVSDPTGPGKIVYVTLPLQADSHGHAVSGVPPAAVQAAHGSNADNGLAGNSTSQPVRAASSAIARQGGCAHVPPCPPAQLPGRLASRVIASHPEQGWSLLCNGVVAFDDAGALLPDGSAVSPHRSVCLGLRDPDVPQAGHARTVAPVPAGRARRAGLRRPGPAMTGAALATPPRQNGSVPASGHRLSSPHAAGAQWALVVRWAAAAWGVAAWMAREAAGS